ncbi:MAG: SBBP repeat-containing protein [Anaerolineae bacterium]|nr:SBBP repeat-containing protein [Anaerolineae bacterium]
MSILRRRRATPFLVAGAAIATLGFFACVALVMGGLLIVPQVTEEEPTRVAASDTPVSASDLYVSPLVTPASPPVEVEAIESALAQPGEQVVAAATDSSLWMSPIEPTPPASAVVAAMDEPGTGDNAPLLIEPVDVPGPTDTLQLVATSQLTLSAIIFVENNGHLATPARFAVRGAPGGSTWLADDAFWIVLLDPRSAPEGGPLAGVGEETGGPAGQRGVMLKVTFPGSNPQVRAEPFNRLDTQVTYLSDESSPGADPTAPVWGGVRYTDLYPGIDLELSSEGDIYTQRLIVEPGGDLNAVRLQVAGAQGVTVQRLAAPDVGREAGEGYYLEVTTELGVFALPLLVVDAPGPLPPPSVSAQGVVESPFTPAAGDLVVPTLGAPPGLLHVNRTGTGGGEEVRDVAVDAAGSAYLAGSSYFPRAFQAPGPFDPAVAGHYQAFAAHLEPGGRALVYATFFGGSGDEIGRAIAIDGSGSAYLAGSTTSADLPTAAGDVGPGSPQAFDTTRAGDEDLFLAKLDPTGREIVYATYLGGAGRDRAEDVTVDDTGGAYVVGWTESPDFPVTQGAWQTSHTGRSGFLVKVNAPGTGLAYGTFLGGSGVDRAQAVAVDQSGIAYVAGVTSSDDLPLTPGSLDGSLDGDSDAFVVVVNASGTAPLYATLFGGAQEDAATGIAVDAAGTIHVGGYTRSPDLPVTSWAAQPGHGGGYDGFMARLDPAAGLLSGTFWGGSADDWVQAVAADANGRACAAGSTASLDMRPGRTGEPLTPAGGFDTFVVCIDNLGFAPTYAALLGGSGDDHASALAINRVGTTYVVAAAGLEHLAGRSGVVGKLVVGAPFLDLPIRYANFGHAALGNVGDRGPGRVNSWFDHNAPTHARNRSLTRWDGVTILFDASSLPRIGESWYDGHGGIDFSWGSSREPVLAAAPGRVVDTVTTCQAGQQTCGGGFGNRVWIDHGNGFATVYGHLDSVDVTVGTTIVDPAAQPLGIMGNTGRSFGTHLHFALYFDANGDGQWKSDEVVDPYGWMGASSDPWRGHSHYLWLHPLFSQQIVGDTALELPGAAQTFLTAPSRFVSITVPSGAMVEPTLIELWDMPPAAEPSASWRSTGRSFLLTGTTLATGADAPGAARPITLTMAIRQGDLRHLDPGRLALRRWDERSGRWETLEGRIDAQNDRVVAYTTTFGRFDLHAPLLCAADSHEPDDHYGAAQTVPADGSRVRRVFDVRDDVDWFRFEGEAGETYQISARSLAAGLALDFKIYDPDSIRQLAATRDGRHIEWQAPTSGTYLVRIVAVGSSPHGCDVAYELSVGVLRAPEAVTITGPTTGTVGDSDAFAASLTPLTVTQPITYVWRVSGELPDELPVTFTSGATPTFTYTWRTADTYRLEVAVTNAAGTVTATHSIQIHPLLKASFTASPTAGPGPLKVKFTDTSVGLYTIRRWQFGDGETGEGEAPAHTYTTPGTYTVTLQVEGEGGEDTATRVAYITVEAAPTPLPPQPSGEFRVYLPVVSR